MDLADVPPKTPLTYTRNNQMVIFEAVADRGEGRTPARAVVRFEDGHVGTVAARHLAPLPARLPRDAAHVIYRDMGTVVDALWAATPPTAAIVRFGSLNTYRQLLQSPTDDIRLLASICRVYKKDGYDHPGWLMITVDDEPPHTPTYAGTTKTAALTTLKAAVATHITHPGAL